MIAQSPKFFVRNELRIGHALPKLRLGDLPFPIHAFGVNLPPPKFPDASLHPTEQMNAVRQMADGYLLDRFVGKETLPHVPAHTAMQLAHSIGGARKLQSKHGHAEGLGQAAQRSAGRRGGHDNSGRSGLGLPNHVTAFDLIRNESHSGARAIVPR